MTKLMLLGARDSFFYGILPRARAGNWVEYDMRGYSHIAVHLVIEKSRPLNQPG